MMGEGQTHPGHDSRDPDQAIDAEPDTYFVDRDELVGRLDEATTERDEDAPIPVPVTVEDIVKVRPQPSRMAITRSMQLGPAGSARLAGRNEARTRLTILTDAPIVLCDDPQTASTDAASAAGPWAGFVIPADLRLVITHTADVWAANPSASEIVTISTLTEQREG
jgi:hypothetical protein